MTAKISQSAWCLRKWGMAPDHYAGTQYLTRLRNVGDQMNFSARVGANERGYDLRISVDFADLQAFYRDRLMFSEQRLADEIAYLSAALAKRIADKKAREKDTAA